MIDYCVSILSTAQALLWMVTACTGGLLADLASRRRRRPVLYPATLGVVGEVPRKSISGFWVKEL